MITVDHSKTRVLLIGVSQYTVDLTITPIPNVETNIQLLGEVLSDQELVGIPKENIAVSLNESRSQILKRLNRLVNETSNKSYTILIYYSGHGFLSSDDLQLYLSTPEIVADDLVDGIGIGIFRQRVKQCVAGRKIIILDCCHSGAIIDVLDDQAGLLKNNLNDFEGTYVITSASEDKSARFPSESPSLPTYFTGKLLEIMREGIDIEQEYCSLKDIYYSIKADFAIKNLPAPQQSNYNNADQIYLSKNRKYNNKSADEIAWERALKTNTISEYSLFKKKYSKSPFFKDASQKIYSLEEEQDWKQASEFNSIFHLEKYVKKYRKGRHLKEAEEKINIILEIEKAKHENMIWANAQESDSIRAYELYLELYPNGQFIDEAKEQITALKLSLSEPTIHPPLNNNKSLLDLFPKWVTRHSYLLFLMIVICALTFIIIKSSRKVNIAKKVNDVHVALGYKQYLNEADKYAASSRYVDAIASYQKAIQIDSGSYNAYFGIANVFYKRHLYDSAIVNYDKAIMLQPKIADIYDKRGDCYLMKANFDLAENDYVQAVKLSDDSARYYCKLGKINNKLKRKNKAMDDFNKAIHFNPQMAEAYEGRGIVFITENLIDSAVIDFSKAISMDSTLAVSYEFRGYIYKSKALYDLALNDLSKAIFLNPSKAKIYLQRAHVHRITNPEGDEACKDYEIASKLGNQSAKEYYDKYCVKSDF